MERRSGRVACRRLLRRHGSANAQPRISPISTTRFVGGAPFASCKRVSCKTRLTDGRGARPRSPARSAAMAGHGIPQPALPRAAPLAPARTPGPRLSFGRRRLARAPAAAVRVRLASPLLPLRASAHPPIRPSHPSPASGYHPLIRSKTPRARPARRFAAPPLKHSFGEIVA